MGKLSRGEEGGRGKVGNKRRDDRDIAETRHYRAKKARGGPYRVIVEDQGGFIDLEHIRGRQHKQDNGQRNTAYRNRTPSRPGHLLAHSKTHQNLRFTEKSYYLNFIYNLTKF